MMASSRTAKRTASRLSSKRVPLHHKLDGKLARTPAAGRRRPQRRMKTPPPAPQAVVRLDIARPHGLPRPLLPPPPICLLNRRPLPPRSPPTGPCRPAASISPVVSECCPLFLLCRCAP
jgi:hypothetical protein